MFELGQRFLVEVHQTHCHIDRVLLRDETTAFVNSVWRCESSQNRKTTCPIS